MNRMEWCKNIILLQVVVVIYTLSSVVAMVTDRIPNA